MILNRASDGLLSVLLVLRRTLVAYGPMNRERLISLCAPENAVKDSTRVTKTITRWTQLGLFEESGTKIGLTPSFSITTDNDLDALRVSLLELALRTENNPAVDESSSDTDKKEYPGATDFTKVAAWALQQDPYSFGNVDDYVEWERMQEVLPAVLRNQTRWDGFQEWAPFFGLAVPFGTRPRVLLMNPSFALRGVLSKVLPSGERTRVDVAMAAIAEQLPILDGGRYWREVEGRTQKPWHRFAPTEVSPCLSLAFRQLRHEGLVRIEDLSDSPTRLALLGRGGRILESVTHITREPT